VSHLLHRPRVDDEIGRASEIVEIGYWHQEDSRSRIMALEIADLIMKLAFQRDFGKEERFGDVDDYIGFGRSDRIRQPQSADLSIASTDFQNTLRPVCIGNTSEDNPSVAIKNSADRSAVELAETLWIRQRVVVHLPQSGDQIRKFIFYRPLAELNL